MAPAAAALVSAATTLSGARRNPKPKIGLGFSLYGMRTLRTPDAIRACAKIGYDDVEFAVYPGWPADPKILSASDRRELYNLFNDLGIGLSSIDEDLRLLADSSAHKENLEKIKRAAQLWQDVYPFWIRTPERRHRMPVLVLTLGGKVADWPDVKNKMADRLGEWAEAGEKHRILLAIKAHVGSALHTPQDAVWLMQQANNPWVKLTYDYSHFHAQGFDMKESIDLMMPDAVFIHAKDARTSGGKVQFLLPGDGETDYVAYLKAIERHGYRGSVAVEVSSQIHTKPGYDPLAAAKHCYANLSKAFEEAGIQRG